MIMMIADNLLSCNRFFKALKKRWVAAGMNEQAMSVRVAKRFCRIAYQMAAGGQVFRHPSCQKRDAILRKLSIFHAEHGSSMAQVMTDLQAATDHIPKSEHAPEAKSLYEELQPRRWKSGVSAYLAKKMNRHRITRPTPFGITEVGTAIVGCRRATLLVLNAFRHHRGGHTASRVMGGRPREVLNAFRHHRGGHRRCRRECQPSSSAQRLSASQRWASTGSLRDARPPDVLNAFRHHRGGHP